MPPKKDAKKKEEEPDVDLNIPPVFVEETKLMIENAKEKIDKLDHISKEAEEKCDELAKRIEAENADCADMVEELKRDMAKKDIANERLREEIVVLKEECVKGKARNAENLASLRQLVLETRMEFAELEQKVKVVDEELEKLEPLEKENVGLEKELRSLQERVEHQQGITREILEGSDLADPDGSVVCFATLVVKTMKRFAHESRLMRECLYSLRKLVTADENSRKLVISDRAVEVTMMVLQTNMMDRDTVLFGYQCLWKLCHGDENAKTSATNDIAVALMLQLFKQYNEDMPVLYAICSFMLLIVDDEQVTLEMVHKGGREELMEAVKFAAKTKTPQTSQLVKAASELLTILMRAAKKEEEEQAELARDVMREQQPQPVMANPSGTVPLMTQRSALMSQRSL